MIFIVPTMSIIAIMCIVYTMTETSKTGTAVVGVEPTSVRTAKPTTWHRNAALVIPLLLVNTAAVYGQQGWAYDHLGHDRLIAILFATAVESIGVYLAAEAHAALMAGDASARLRLGSYLVGLLVGTLNFAHFASHGYRANPVALTFGLLSSISPLLWSIRSRSLNRDRLRELGQVDPRAVRFSILRWVLFPIRTGSAFRAAVWAGVVQPAEAVAAADAARAARRGAPKGGRPVTQLRAVDAAGEAVAVKPATPRRTASSADKVARTAARMPGATPTEVAARVGVTERTARRHMSPKTGDAPVGTVPTAGPQRAERSSRQLTRQPALA